MSIKSNNHTALISSYISKGTQEALDARLNGELSRSEQATVAQNEIDMMERKLGIDDRPVEIPYRCSVIAGTTAYNAFQDPTISLKETL